MLISGPAPACVLEDTITLYRIFERCSDIRSDSSDETDAERLVQKRRRWLRDIVTYSEAILKRIDGETAEAFMENADFHDAVNYDFIVFLDDVEVSASSLTLKPSPGRSPHIGGSSVATVRLPTFPEHRIAGSTAVQNSRRQRASAV